VAVSAGAGAARCAGFDFGAAATGAGGGAATGGGAAAAGAGAGAGVGSGAVIAGLVRRDRLRLRLRATGGTTSGAVLSAGGSSSTVYSRRTRPVDQVSSSSRSRNGSLTGCAEVTCTTKLPSGRDSRSKRSWVRAGLNSRLAWRKAAWGASRTWSVGASSWPTEAPPHQRAAVARAQIARSSGPDRQHARQWSRAQS